MVDTTYDLQHRCDSMLPNNKAATYVRAAETRGKEIPYDDKFAELIKLCETVRVKGVDNVIVARPWVLGDTYEEVIESLSRIAAAGLILHIVERDENHLMNPRVAQN